MAFYISFVLYITMKNKATKKIDNLKSVQTQNNFSVKKVKQFLRSSIQSLDSGLIFFEKSSIAFSKIFYQSLDSRLLLIGGYQTFTAHGLKMSHFGEIPDVVLPKNAQKHQYQQLNIWRLSLIFQSQILLRNSSENFRSDIATQIQC